MFSDVRRQKGETERAYVERITGGPRPPGGLTANERRLLWMLAETARDFWQAFAGGPRRWEKPRNFSRREKRAS